MNAERGRPGKTTPSNRRDIRPALTVPAELMLVEIRVGDA